MVRFRNEFLKHNRNPNDLFDCRRRRPQWQKPCYLMCWWLAKTDAAVKSVSAVCVTTPTVPAMRSCVRSMYAQFDRACPVGNLVSRRKWSLQCVPTMVSIRMWIFRLADNHRDSDASILVFKSVDATVYAFSYSTRTPPTSGDDGVRQPSLQISLKRRGRKLLEQF